MAIARHRKNDLGFVEMQQRIRSFKLLGLAWIILGSLLLLSQCHRRSRTVMTRNPTEAAKEAFRNGVDLYEKGKYQEAESSFLTAYNNSPSYKILYNMAQAQVMQSKNTEAARTFRRYLQEGGRDIPPDRRETVEGDIRGLEGKGSTPSARASGRTIRPITAMSGEDVEPKPENARPAEHADAGAPRRIRPVTSGQ